MANVTEAEVRKVINLDGEEYTDLDISFHIETADLLVGGRLSDVDYTVELLDRITLYLAAHFTSLFIREAEEEELGDSREKYTRELEQGLASTRFGQQALTLDYEAILKSDSNIKFKGVLSSISNVP
jgi:hypothetical protein